MQSPLTALTALTALTHCQISQWRSVHYINILIYVNISTHVYFVSCYLVSLWYGKTLCWLNPVSVYFRPKILCSFLSCLVLSCLLAFPVLPSAFWLSRMRFLISLSCLLSYTLIPLLSCNNHSMNSNSNFRIFQNCCPVIIFILFVI